MQVESRLVLLRGAGAEARPRSGLPGLPQAAVVAQRSLRGRCEAADDEGLPLERLHLCACE
eukprot:5535966-Alexandrium_andersonii.AAC.1